MASLIRNFRSWWRYPRRASEPQDRTVSFLELFYDLVYVVLVAELAHALAEHVDWQGVGTFAFLFVIVWWSWFNGSTYHDLHGNNDIRTRVFTFLQMVAVAGMAFYAHNALSGGSVGFALSYVAFQLVLTYLWWRTGVHDPEHRILSNPYAFTFLITTVLFLISVVVPTPFRFYLWGLTVVFSLIQPIRQFMRTDERARSQIRRFLEVSPALVERFGLLTIVVLAEVIVGVVQGLADRSYLDAPAGWTAALGMIVAFSFWGLYFDFVSHRPPVAERLPVSIWLYLQLFITMSIAATGAAVLNVVEHAGAELEPNVRWLLVAAIAVFLLSLVPIMQVIQVSAELKKLYRAAGLVTLISAVAVALLGLTSLAAIPLLAIVIALMLIPVVYGLLVWIVVFGARDIAPH